MHETEEEITLEKEQQHLDLNSQPLCEYVEPNNLEDGRKDVSCSVRLVEGQKGDAIKMLEVEATKVLGSKLGVSLEGFDTLIQESIDNEGLQAGKK